ncbi:MAG: hypothetical protein K0R39_2819 [Symbiobacteriaceae bacterium]|jgi:hypothetical protein|nr:hypothetical protein [Symbiobacteriaceae bacterium]
MILVVAEQLNLRFLLLHQGKFIQSARTATEALRILRNGPGNLQGVVLDEKVTNSRLVSGYVRTHIPNLTLVSMQLAMRHSPFSDVAPAQGMVAAGSQSPEVARYVWDRSQAINK